MDWSGNKCRWNARDVLQLFLGVILAMDIFLVPWMEMESVVYTVYFYKATFPPLAGCGYGWVGILGLILWCREAGAKGYFWYCGCRVGKGREGKGVVGRVGRKLFFSYFSYG